MRVPTPGAAELSAHAVLGACRPASLASIQKRAELSGCRGTKLSPLTRRWREDLREQGEAGPEARVI